MDRVGARAVILLLAAGAFFSALGCDYFFEATVSNHRAQEVTVFFVQQNQGLGELTLGSVRPCTERSFGGRSASPDRPVTFIVRDAQGHTILTSDQEPDYRRGGRVSVAIPAEQGRSCPQPLTVVPTPTPDLDLFR